MKSPGQIRAQINNPAFYRPAEVDILLGDSSKARRVLGWKPEIDLRRMIYEMVDAELDRLRRDAAQYQWLCGVTHGGGLARIF